MDIALSFIIYQIDENCSLKTLDYQYTHYHINTSYLMYLFTNASFCILTKYFDFSFVISWGIHRKNISLHVLGIFQGRNCIFSGTRRDSVIGPKPAIFS